MKMSLRFWIERAQHQLDRGDIPAATVSLHRAIDEHLEDQR